MTRLAYLGPLGLLFAGLVLGSMFGAQRSVAQQTVSQVAIATEGNLVWVVRGDQLVVCRVKPVQTNVMKPPAPECGDPLPLPQAASPSL